MSKRSLNPLVLRRARVHHGRLHHEQALEAPGQKFRREQEIGRAGAVADAVDVVQIECIDHPADILGKIQEMIVIG